MLLLRLWTVLSESGIGSVLLVADPAWFSTTPNCCLWGHCVRGMLLHRDVVIGHIARSTYVGQLVSHILADWKCTADFYEKVN